MSGTFKAEESVAEDDLTRFARTAVPIILFPYLREQVHRVTMDGTYGPVRMDPVNLASLLGPEGWQQVSLGDDPGTGATG